MKYIFTRFSLTVNLLALSFCTFAQSESRQKLSEIQAQNRELTQIISQIAEAVNKDKHKVMEPLLHEIMERITSIVGYASALPTAYANGVLMRTDKLKERAMAFESFIHKSGFLDKDRKLRQAFDDVKATNDDLAGYLLGVDQDLARLEKIAEPAPQLEVVEMPDIADKPSPVEAVSQTSQASLTLIREAVVEIQKRIGRIGKLLARNQFSEIAREAKELGLSALKVNNLSLLLDGKRKATAGDLSSVLYRQAERLHNLAHKGKATHHHQHEAFEALETKAQLLFSAIE